MEFFLKAIKSRVSRSEPGRPSAWDHLDAPALNRFIQSGRERLMPIMEKKLVILIAREGFPQLLESPLKRAQAAGRGTKQKRNSADLAATRESVVRVFLRSWMFSDIEAKQTSGSDLQGNEYIKDTESYRH